MVAEVNAIILSYCVNCHTETYFNYHRDGSMPCTKCGRHFNHARGIGDAL